MITPTNWPNPERPGWPPNPEKDGLYAMRIDEKFIVRYWSATRQHYSLVPEWKKGISPLDASVFTFCGEILTPTQITEMLAVERERAAKEATEISDNYCEQREEADNDDDRVYADERMCAAQECADAIRNLGDAP